MRTPLVALLTVGLLLPAAWAATTINSSNKFAYGENIGWSDWRGDTNNGAVIGAYVCSGYILAANVGWIHLGNGVPGNGIRYQNNSVTDFGVNHDGVGHLSGYAYGANIGWLTFTNRDPNGALYDGPRLDLLTGRLSGFVWSANCGWISLSNALAFLRTDTLDGGPDTDNDGLPDAWERQYARNLSALNGGDDKDGDGLTNTQEFLSDTDPLDPNSKLRITLVVAQSMRMSHTIEWTSRPTRLYRIEKRSDLNPGYLWSDAGFGLISPDTGATTTRTFRDDAVQRFFRIQGIKPLSP